MFHITQRHNNTNVTIRPDNRHSTGSRIDTINTINIIHLISTVECHLRMIFYLPGDVVPHEFS